VLDSYWRFAVRRQDAFMRRVTGAPPPWTDDPVIASHRFTNPYRASDRVSQYLIRHVIYEGKQTTEEIFFRTVLFKLFNRIQTWECLMRAIGPPEWKTYDVDLYAGVLDRALTRGERVYSAAYIMPSPPFGNARKHRNHLALLAAMMRNGLPAQIESADSLEHVFVLLREQPSLGDFLAFQFAVDLNYSEVIDFSEMDYVVAGPGARNGIRKCFADTAGLSETELIGLMPELAEHEFARLGLRFQTLWGRPLQLVDYQNLFCEVDKYARVVHPGVAGLTGRTRIKQKFAPRREPLAQWYPPKWKLSVPAAACCLNGSRCLIGGQQALPFVFGS
jgi:hypothetical protein